MSRGESSAQRETLVRVVKGAPTEEEVAALVVALESSAAGPRRGGRVATRSLWFSPGRRVRPTLRPGPGAWRASGLPR
ncbi:MAG: acyl-CoA carboxylase subunit epsilon [Nocardioidaceae bacterium]